MYKICACVCICVWMYTFTCVWICSVWMRLARPGWKQAEESNRAMLGSDNRIKIIVNEKH